MPFRDLLIASVAIANGLPLITLDRDFEALRELGFDVHII
ncbi:PIN domain-containing protein [Thermococcus eurythermalis]